MNQPINYLNRTGNPEEELKLTQERFNLIFQNTSVSIWDYIFETKQIIQASRSQELHGFDTVVENVPDSLIESGFIHPDSAAAFREMYDKMFAGEEHVEGIFRVQTADRKGYWYEHIRYHVLFDEAGRPCTAVGMSTDDTDEIVLQKKADSDSLTGLLNKEAFKERMKSTFSRHPEQTHVLLSMDLDDFKQINDNYGHATGDELLRCVAGVISEQVGDLPKTTYIARAGGDEFMILLCDSSVGAAASVAQALFDSFKKPLLEGIYVHASMGIAVYPKDGDTPERLELAADRALYSVKHQEKNGYCFYGDGKANSVLRIQRRQQFLSDTMSGGMLGGYMEPGFPFYFIDNSLLSWLGYSSEEEYVTDIDGLVENGIHPEDRDFVNAEVDRQLALATRYAVDYRMRKKDGSYIWVHDIGETMVAEDGRSAITSVCYDISAEKERDNLLTNLLDGLEAKVGLYRLEADGVLKLLHASKDIMDMTHYSDEEYIEMCSEDAIDFVYTPDREQVRKAIIQSVKENKVITENFRLLDKQDGYAWVSGVISRLGSHQESAAVRIVFMPVSLQNELQIQVLDSDYIGVYVIDTETSELYYANKASMAMFGTDETEVVGRTCHEVFWGEKRNCEFCWRNQEHAANKTLHIKNGRDLSFEVQEKTWNHRHIAIVYIRDVTEETRLQRQRQELFENVPAGIAMLSIKNGELHPLFFSAATEHLLGTKPERMMESYDPEIMFRCVHPDDIPRLLAQLQEDIRSERSQCYYKYRCWHEQRGEYIWVELHANTQTRDGETFIYATYNDMTRANHAQNELEKNQSAMDTIIQYANLGVWSYDLDTRELKQEYSRRVVDGYETCQSNIPEAYIEQGKVYPEDAAVFRKCYDRILSGEAASDCIVRFYNFSTQSYLWTHIYLIRQEDTLDGKRRALGFSMVIDREITTIRELEHTQAELLQNREMLQYACSFSGLYTATYHINTRTIYLDEVAQRAFGVSGVIDHFPDSAGEHTKVVPAYLEGYKQKFEELCAGAENIEYDFESYDANGRPHWVRMKCHRITSNQREPIAVVTTQLIDLEKSMLARLEQERERLQARDKDLLHYYVANLTQNRVTEYQYIFMEEPVFPEDLSTEEHFEFCGSKISFREDYDRVMKLHDRKRLLSCFEQGKCQDEYDSQLTLPDGTIRFMTGKINLLSDPATGDVLLYESVYDTSSEQIMTNMLKLNMEHGYEVVGHWINGNDQLTIMEMDSQMGKSELKRTKLSVYANQYMEDSVLLEDRENYRKFYESIAKETSGKSRDLLYRTKSADGSIRYHKATAAVYDQKKGIYLLTRRDYTDVIRGEAEKNKRLSAALEEAKQANEAKNDFMARMSHDMRTPMNAILGMTHLALDENNNPKTAEYIKQIEESSRYLLGIINDVLEMGRIESGKTILNYEWCTWREILEPVLHMIEPIMEEKEITFVYQKEALKTFPIEFYVDRQKSQQMLMNLLNNACKFTPAGGTIRLHFCNLALDRAKFTSTDQIIIEDTGCGMSEEFLNHLFEPFALERLPGMEGIPGTGLGLPISRNIARQMGGDITAESRVGQGSVFKITYPYRYRYSSLQKEKQEFEEKTAIEEAVIFADKRILLVEDNKVNAVIAKKILEKKGLQVVMASNGKEALDLFAGQPEGSFHLILMDIRMPVMDGLEATRQIRSLNRPDAQIVPIIATSANAYEEDRQLSLAAGMNDHLSKPVEPEKLYRTIQKYLIGGETA